MANEINYIPCKYKGNGTTLNFPFGWNYFNDSEIIVNIENSSGVQTVLTLGTDYEVKRDTTGGEVICKVAPTSEEYIIISRDTSNLQKTRYSTSVGFQGTEIEKSFDKVSCCLQDIVYSSKRAIKTPIGSTVLDLSLPQPNAGKTLKWNEDNTGLINSNVNIDDISDAVQTAKDYSEQAQNSATNASNSAENARIASEKLVKLFKQLPEQEGNADKFLKTDGNTTSWADVPPATTITTYHNVVSSNNKTVVFGSDYSSVSAIDISAYTDGVYRVFVKNQNNGIIPKTYTEGATAPTSPVEGDIWHYIPTEGEGECYKQYLTVTTPATEEGGEPTTTTEWQVIDAVEVAKIRIAGGRLAEILSSLQYLTNTPLTEVKEHTLVSADSLTEDEEGKINFVPFTFTPVNYTDYDVISANTNYTMTRDGIFYATAIASVTYTEGDISSTITTNVVIVKAGDTFKSSVAGKFYYYY